jgi:hypothetical protein
MRWLGLIFVWAVVAAGAWGQDCPSGDNEGQAATASPHSKARSLIGMDD